MKNEPHLIVAREQLVEEGYCVVDGGLDEAFLAQLIDWSNHHIDTHRTVDSWKYQGSDIKIGGIRYQPTNFKIEKSEPIVDRIIELPAAALEAMQIDDLLSIGLFQIISKPAASPALYWHQDWWQWDDPMSASPWPQQIFVNYYLHETTPDNGCLRVIPGTHRRRIDLHDHLTPPHEGGGYDVAQEDEWMFFDHPAAVDVPVVPGQLVIADGRLLHGTHPNRTDQRRTVLLGWYRRRVFTVPAWWVGDVPQAIRERPADFENRFNRIPGEYLARA